jgi:hypothetical protein
VTKHQSVNSERFDRVWSTLNCIKAKSNDAHPELIQVLEAAGVTESQWYTAARAVRESSPDTFELFYKALGVDPPKERRRREPEPDDEQPDGQEDDEPDKWTPAQVMASVLELFDSLADRERGRILRSVAIFYEINL